MGTLFDGEWRARFEEFWDCYPRGERRFRRGEAEALFVEICRGERPGVAATPDQIIAAATRYAELVGSSDGCVMPPARWLAQECWRHELGDFEAFWACFPKGRKRKKGEARKVFLSICKEQLATPEQLIAGAARYAAAMGPGHPYVQMPTTWLRGSCWEDDADERATPSAWQRLQDRSWSDDG